MERKDAHQPLERTDDSQLSPLSNKSLQEVHSERQAESKLLANVRAEWTNPNRLRGTDDDVDHGSEAKRGAMKKGRCTRHSSLSPLMSSMRTTTSKEERMGASHADEGMQRGEAASFEASGLRQKQLGISNFQSKSA